MKFPPFRFSSLSVSFFSQARRALLASLVYASSGLLSAHANEFDPVLSGSYSDPSSQAQDSEQDLDQEVNSLPLSPQGSYFMDKADTRPNTDEPASEQPIYQLTETPSQRLPDNLPVGEAPPMIPKLTTTEGQRIQASAQTEVLILKSAVVLDSNLSEKFNAYEFSIENHWRAPIELMQTQAVGSVDPEHGYLSVLKRPQGMVGGVFGSGAANVVGGIVLGTTSAMTMLNQGTTRHQNAKTAREANLFVKQLPQGTLQSGQRVTFKVLVPAGTQPELRVTFLDTDTQRVFAIGG